MVVTASTCCDTPGAPTGPWEPVAPEVPAGVQANLILCRPRVSRCTGCRPRVSGLCRPRVSGCTEGRREVSNPFGKRLSKLATSVHRWRSHIGDCKNYLVYIGWFLAPESKHTSNCKQGINDVRSNCLSPSPLRGIHKRLPAHVNQGIIFPAPWFYGQGEEEGMGNV